MKKDLSPNRRKRKGSSNSKALLAIKKKSLIRER